MTEIVFINQSTVIGTDKLRPIIDALQTQVSRDFAPVYGVDAKLSLADGSLPIDKWWIAILDDADQAGALGYHDLTSSGLPLGKVFAKTDLKVGDEISVTMSHELLEMLGDPFINLCFQAGDGGIYAYEVGDPVEADGLGYQIDGVKVSDFVLPAYFEVGHDGNQRTDFMDHLRKKRAPALTSEGYISRLDPASGQWTQINGRHASHMARESLIRSHAPIGSRRWRRNVPLSARIVSKAPSNE